MARKPPLRVVEESETVKSPQRPMSVLEAAEKGSRLDELVSLRRRIARAIDDPNCATRDLASLSRRQLEISREIEAITAHDEGDEVGDAAATPDEKWASS